MESAAKPIKIPQRLATALLVTLGEDGSLASQGPCAPESRFRSSESAPIGLTIFGWPTWGPNHYDGRVWKPCPAINPANRKRILYKLKSLLQKRKFRVYMAY